MPKRLILSGKGWRFGVTCSQGRYTAESVGMRPDGSITPRWFPPEEDRNLSVGDIAKRIDKERSKIDSLEVFGILFQDSDDAAAESIEFAKVLSQCPNLRSIHLGFASWPYQTCEISGNSKVTDSEIFRVLGRGLAAVTKLISLQLSFNNSHSANGRDIVVNSTLANQVFFDFINDLSRNPSLQQLDIFSESWPNKEAPIGWTSDMELIKPDITQYRMRQENMVRTLLSNCTQLSVLRLGNMKFSAGFLTGILRNYPQLKMLSMNSLVVDYYSLGGIEVLNTACHTLERSRVLLCRNIHYRDVSGKEVDHSFLGTIFPVGVELGGRSSLFFKCGFNTRLTADVLGWIRTSTRSNPNPELHLDSDVAGPPSPRL